VLTGESMMDMITRSLWDICTQTYTSEGWIWILDIGLILWDNH